MGVKWAVDDEVEWGEEGYGGVRKDGLREGMMEGFTI